MVACGGGSRVEPGMAVTQRQFDDAMLVDGLVLPMAEADEPVLMPVPVLPSVVEPDMPDGTVLLPLPMAVVPLALLPTVPLGVAAPALVPPVGPLP